MKFLLKKSFSLATIFMLAIFVECDCWRSNTAPKPNDSKDNKTVGVVKDQLEPKNHGKIQDKLKPKDKNKLQPKDQGKTQDELEKSNKINNNSDDKTKEELQKQELLNLEKRYNEAKDSWNEEEIKAMEKEIREKIESYKTESDQNLMKIDNLEKEIKESEGALTKIFNLIWPSDTSSDKKAQIKNLRSKNYLLLLEIEDLKKELQIHTEQTDSKENYLKILDKAYQEERKKIYQKYQ